MTASLTPAGAAAPRGAPPVIMPGSEIAVGMTGIGKTVILGTQIVEFQVRVLGILRNAGPAGNLVLFRASGPAIQSVGGIAAGMSGSPIYLGGRLAGALGYTFQAADPTVGLFTPIEDMLKALPGHTARARTVTAEIAPVRIGGRIVRRIIVASARAAPSRPPSETAVAVPAATPLFVSGVDAGGLEVLAEHLAPMGLVPVRGSAQVRLPASLPLEPGSAIGIALMQGDLAAYAIGTLTYRNGNLMLGFGHPFAGVGRASYLLTNATIFQTVRGQQQNIKVGAAGVAVGTVSEDRPAGIGGTIGVLPRMFGVRVRVTDDDASATRTFTFQIIPRAEMAPALVLLGAQGAVERALNRSGQGTARVRIVLHGRALSGPVVRENIFYSAGGIASRAMAEVPQAMRLLFDNDFADVGPRAMELGVRVTGQQQTAVLTDASVIQQPVAPGGTLRARVTVRPFRAVPETREITLAVPAEFPSGPAMLVVRAGGQVPASGPGPTPASPAAQGAAPRTLEDAIRAFEAGEKNTDIVVEITSGTSPRGETGVVPAGPPRTSVRSTTSWVLRGRFQIPIVIGGGGR